MKVLLVSLWPISKQSIGGTERYILDLAKHLKYSGVLVDVLIISGERSVIDGVQYIPIHLFNQDKSKVDEYSIKKMLFPKLNDVNLRNFAKLVSKKYSFEKYDLIHFNSLLFLYCCPNKKRNFTIHENPFEFEKNWGDGSWKVITKEIKKCISKHKTDISFIAPSKFYSGQYSKEWGASVTAISHAIDAKRLKLSRNRSFILKKYSLAADSYNILIPCRLEIKQKGQDIAMKVLGTIKDQLPKFRLILAGVDAQYIQNVEYLKRIAYKLEINCAFIAFEKMSEAYKIADLIILPSRSESFGYSALESISLNKKTVLSNIPTFKEVAGLSPFAFIFRVNNQTSLAKAIIKAYGAGFGGDNEHIINTWKKIFSMKDWVNKYIAFYAKCINR